MLRFLFITISYYNGSIAEVYNSTLKATASFNVTPLQPSTVYNISVIPCNMAGCNESCDIHSVQTMARGEMVECIVQLKQQSIILGVNTASIVYAIVLVFCVHSEQGDASRLDFDITFTVIAAAAAGVVVLRIAMVTAVVIVTCTLKRFVLRSSVSH